MFDTWLEYTLAEIIIAAVLMSLLIAVVVVVACRDGIREKRRLKRFVRGEDLEQEDEWESRS